MAVTPLSWPETVQHPTPMQRFLTGLPFLGPDKCAYRHFRREVAAREPEDCRSLWTKYMPIISVRDKVLEVLEDTMRWRSRNFIPADPIDILLFHPGWWFGGEDSFFAQLHLMKLFRRCPVLKIMNHCKDGTLGDLVEALAGNKEEHGEMGVPREKSGGS